MLVKFRCESITPFGRVLADQHDAIARFDSLVSEESSRARRQLAQVCVGVLFFAAVALDTHRDASGVTFGRSLEQLQQIAIGVDAFWLSAQVLFERGKDPLL